LGRRGVEPFLDENPESDSRNIEIVFPNTVRGGSRAENFL
jgi:hypothetical protein